MFSYDHGQLSALFENIIKEKVDQPAFEWLKEKTAARGGQFNTAFVTIPRRTGKANIQLTEEQEKNISVVRAGLIIKNWTTDRLARVWLLMNADTGNKDSYFKSIENLFTAAEVNELVALYSSLPVLAWPEIWKQRCAEGIRNNIGDVLLSILCNNPYPSENLDDSAWNQLVLKAFFTEKPIEEIIGIDKRANIKLAETLSDYAHERWAAHRSVNPQLWRCVGPFINEKIFPDIQKIAASDNPIEKEAAALAAHSSNYPPAKELIPSSLQSAIGSGELTWNILAEKTKDYVLQS